MIYFLVPVFNEAPNIQLLAESLKRTLTEEKFFLFVDDCSTDNSVGLIEKNFSSENYFILKKESNSGPGNSFNMGFEWILNHSENIENDIVVTIEADNTSDLSILPVMVMLSKFGFSLVLASVYAQGGGFDKTSFGRKIISFFANMLFRMAFNIKVLTLSSFYRVYHLSLIRSIKQKNSIIIKESGFLSMLEILLKSISLQAQIIEVPMVLYSGKRMGKSKMKIFKTAYSYFRILINHKFTK